VFPATTVESVYVSGVTNAEFNLVYGPPLLLELYTLYPDAMPDAAEVLAFQVSVTECATGWTPVPERVIVAGEFVALLATVTLPVRLPAAAGENVTSSVALCPGARIRPVETPLAVKPGPARVILEIVTFEVPAFESVTPIVLLPPADTVPKLRLVELASSRAAATTAIPLTLTVAGELEALLMTDTAPDAAPMLLGEKTTLRFACWPAAIVIGNEAPVIVNTLPETLACVTTRLDPPSLDTVTDWEEVPLTATWPNVIEDGDTEIDAAAGAF
jgi:hypothetical protein